MARIKQVPFLRYFNGSRMLIVFELDSVIVVTVSFVLSYIAMTQSSFKVSITMLSSLIIAVSFGLGYSKAKSNASKGFLRHWTYVNVNPLFEILFKKKKYKEFEKMDVKDYVPAPEDFVFND